MRARLPASPPRTVDVPATTWGIGLGSAPDQDPAYKALKPSLVRLHDFTGPNWWRWHWASLEQKPGVWRWAPLDEAVARLHADGCEISMTLYGTPTWASSRPQEIGAYGAGFPGSAAPPADLKHWTAYCAAVATRYKGRITHYEVWNEPNWPHFWSGDVATLAQMVVIAHDTIKGIDPEAKIISPPVAGLEFYNDGAAYLRSLLPLCKGKFDIIGCHLYPGSFAAIGQISAMANSVRAAANAAGVSHSTPIWNTEITILRPEWATLTAAQRTMAIQAVMTLAGPACGIERSIWYNPGRAGGPLSFDAHDCTTWIKHRAALAAGGVSVVQVGSTGSVSARIGGSLQRWNFSDRSAVVVRR